MRRGIKKKKKKKKKKNNNNKTPASHTEEQKSVKIILRHLLVNYNFYAAVLSLHFIISSIVLRLYATQICFISFSNVICD